MKEEKQLRAFPKSTGVTDENSLGMTLRDYFANSVMKSIITNETLRKHIESNTITIEQMYNDISKVSYEMAETMLKQRELYLATSQGGSE
jgi:hypothetical protein